MRMSRFDWLARFFRPETPRRRGKREQREKKEPRVWLVLGKRFVAFTKSEARSQAKRALGLPRLPAGTKVIQVCVGSSTDFLV